MSQILSNPRKKHCGGCKEKVVLRPANTITSVNPLPCNIGTNKLFTGEIANQDFEGDLTLVTANTELITVDNDFLNFIDVPLDPCGGKLKIKGHSHLTLSEDFKKKLEELGGLGTIEERIENLFNSKNFRYFLGIYIKRLIEDGILVLPNNGNTPVVTDFNCNTLESCPNFTSLKSTINTLEARIRELENRLNNSPTTPIVTPVVDNNPQIQGYTIEGSEITYPFQVGKLLQNYSSTDNSSLQYVEIITTNSDLFTPGSIVSLSDLSKVYYTGKENIDIYFRGINSNTIKTNMAKISIIFSKVADTFDRCIRLSSNDGNNTSVYNILRNTLTSGNFGSLVFQNICETPFTVSQQVIINENGLRVTLPSFTVPGNSSVEKQFVIEGTYTGTKNTLTGTLNINGTSVVALVNVANPDTAPIANAVTKEFPNRFVGGTITVSDLNWSDAEQDSLEKVRFTGNVSNLFLDSAYTQAYVAGTELEPNFVLYVKAPDQDNVATIVADYNVKAGGKWSN